jgi:hypothetical protein
MNKSKTMLYYATDKDFFDALMSSRQQFSEASLRDIGRGRGIFYSEREERIVLADSISLLAFGYKDVSEIVAEFERAGRGEKSSSMRICASLTRDEIKTITDDLVKASAEDGEKATTYLKGESGCAIDVKYNELDLSRTTLRQIQRKDAHIEVRVSGGEMVITYPSTAKGAAIAHGFSKRVNTLRSTVIDTEEIDFSGFNDPTAKTEFFYRLVTSLPGFKMEDVTSVHVESAQREASAIPSELISSSEEEDDEDALDESEQMLGVVRAVALQGESLLSSREYQSLQKRGFFISKIQWSAKRQTSPFQVVEFDASFDDPKVGYGFKYSVRGWSTQKNGVYTKGFNQIPPTDKQELMRLLEERAMALFRELRSEALAEQKLQNSQSEAEERADNQEGTDEEI